MSDLFWLTEAQMERLRPFFPLSHGVPRVDDRRVLSGIIFINRNGLRWRDAPADYGPAKTLYNRWVRWSRLGVFARMLTELAAQGQQTETVMIDATHLKAHCTASSLRGKKGACTLYRPQPRRADLEAARRHRCEGSARCPGADRGADLGLHRRKTAAVSHTGRRDASRRPWLRCGLVPQRLDRTGYPALHPVPRPPQGVGPA